MQPTLTIEQILGLAPDRFQVKATENIAIPQKWLSLNRDAGHVWGEFANNKAPYRAQIALTDFALACTCPTRKRPCRHSLSLLLLFKQQPEIFVYNRAPSWINPKRPQETAVASPQHNTISQHQTQISAGMTELALWLRDMIRHGLADLSAKPPRYWTQMIDRLIDTHAETIAQELREISRLPGKQDNWLDELLQRIGRLYLITQGYQRFDTLSAGAQADLRATVGWFPIPGPTEGEFLTDKWLILGRHSELPDQNRFQNVWLWGLDHNRPARVEQRLDSNGRQPTSLFTGSLLETELHFLPSRYPLQARFTAPYALQTADIARQGQPSLTAAIKSYAKALARNPWLQQYPLLLETAVTRHNDLWFISDHQGAILPLPEKFAYGWHLLALQEKKPLTLFGLWNGRIFTPLTIRHENSWLDLHTLRGVL